MFRLWAKKWKSNHLLQDMTVENADPDLNQTRKIYQALDEVCYAWDLEKPIWLEQNMRDFKHRSRTRFSKDSFIEQIDFDYLEIEVIEEDI